MPPVLFRCPSTGLRVQAWVPDEEPAEAEDGFTAVTCLACSQTHLVHPRSGRTLGENEG